MRGATSRNTIAVIGALLFGATLAGCTGTVPRSDATPPTPPAEPSWARPGVDLPHPWTTPWPEPAAVESLYQEFARYTQSPDAYEARIVRDAVGYPEGPLLTSALAAYGFANYSLAHPEAAAECRERIDRLIQVASRPSVRRRLVTPMREDVAELSGWNGQGVYLGHYCLMLACYRVAGGDDRYAERQERIADVLKQGFEAGEHSPWIRSYPHRAWLFDSLPCLLAIRLSDAQNGRDLRESEALIAEHLRYRRRMSGDEAGAFNATEIDCQTGRPLVGARGCDLSASICFLGHLAPGYCRDLYACYKSAFWIEVGDGSARLSGFREWPPGVHGFEDPGSGPILFDIGAAASGFGLGASRVAGDAEAHRTLRATLDRMVTMVDVEVAASEFLERVGREMQSCGILASQEAGPARPEAMRPQGRAVISQEYRYRNLMADAVAFYCLTWRPWCVPLVEGTE